MFDKILLILLILLLPLGIVASRLITGELTIGSGISSIQEKKIELLVDQLTQQASAPDAPKESIQVTAAIYASESSTLTISGITPDTQAFLWIWTASSKARNDKKVATSSAGQSNQPIWAGPLVFWPGAGGNYSVTLDMSQMAGIAEIRMEQGNVLSHIRYDLDNQKILQ